MKTQNSDNCIANDMVEKLRNFVWMTTKVMQILYARISQKSDLNFKMKVCVIWMSIDVTFEWQIEACEKGEWETEIEVKRSYCFSTTQSTSCNPIEAWSFFGKKRKRKKRILGRNERVSPKLESVELSMTKRRVAKFEFSFFKFLHLVFCLTKLLSTSAMQAIS